MDMRYTRTENLLRNALYELGKTKDIYEITVSELTQKAEINRLSFYLHYDNIEHFISTLEDEYIECFVKKMAPFSDFLDNPESIIKRMMTFYQNENSTIFMKGSKSYLFTQKGMNRIIHEIIQNSNVDDDSFRLKVIFIENGIKGVFDNNKIPDDKTIKQLAHIIKCVLT
ncbi:MAG: TetR/AcrR family transcriptional regulator [Erysipelotrichaceae bacterium]|nr:TetR/AcrR family transcriptional regulator [Erysipelotrichaceae bacterium]